MDQSPPPPKTDDDIASYEVSEDGVRWRPFDPAKDLTLRLHRRIQFVSPAEDEAPPR
jgi:hypothetical protein